MQVTKGTWRMRKQCVPGSLSFSHVRESGNEANVYYAQFTVDIQTNVWRIKMYANNVLRRRYVHNNINSIILCSCHNTTHILTFPPNSFWYHPPSLLSSPLPFLIDRKMPNGDGTCPRDAAFQTG